MFITKYSNKLLYIKRSNIFPHIGRYETGWQFLETCLSPFLWTGTTIAFFPFIRKTDLFWCKIRKLFLKVFKWNHHIFWLYEYLLWALLRSRFRIILAISLLLNNINEIHFSVLFKNVEGKFAGVIHKRRSWIFPLSL